MSSPPPPPLTPVDELALSLTVVIACASLAALLFGGSILCCCCWLRGKRSLWRTRIKREWGHPGHLSRDDTGALMWRDASGRAIRGYGASQPSKAAAASAPSPPFSALDAVSAHVDEESACAPEVSVPMLVLSAEAPSPASTPELAPRIDPSAPSGLGGLANLSLPSGSVPGDAQSFASTDPASPMGNSAARRALAAARRSHAAGRGYRVSIRGTPAASTLQIDRTSTQDTIESVTSDASEALTPLRSFGVGVHPCGAPSHAPTTMMLVHPAAIGAGGMVPLCVGSPESRPQAPPAAPRLHLDDDEEEVEEELELPKKGHPSRMVRARKANAAKGRLPMTRMPPTHETDM